MQYTRIITMFALLIKPGTIYSISLGVTIAGNVSKDVETKVRNNHPRNFLFTF